MVPHIGTHWRAPVQWSTPHAIHATPLTLVLIGELSVSPVQWSTPHAIHATPLTLVLIGELSVSPVQWSTPHAIHATPLTLVLIGELSVSPVQWSTPHAIHGTPLTLVLIGELSVSPVQWYVCHPVQTLAQTLNPYRASERRAHHLLHPGGLSVSELNPNRLRVVVFRDDKGMKLPIFDSQLYTNEEGEVSPFSMQFHVKFSVPFHIILHSIPFRSTLFFIPFHIILHSFFILFQTF